MKSIEKKDSEENYLVLCALDAYEIETSTVMNKTASIVFIRPSYHGNPKLGAQKGLFTLWEFVNRYGRQISSDPTLLDVF